MNSNYEIGDTVKILHCFHAHEFEIGEIVCIVAKSDNDNGLICKNSKGSQWYLYPEEIVMFKRGENSVLSKRFVIEVFFNGERIEYRTSENKEEIEREFSILKETYINSDCVFYKGELNLC